MSQGRITVDERAGPGGGMSDEYERAIPVNAAQLGLWFFLATLVMLFAGFTSAYLVRQTTGTDWVPIPLPSILWWNTMGLMLSSVTLEAGRAQLRRRRLRQLRVWLLLTASLGLAFLAGQLLAWRQFASLGVFLPSNPHSSFFYILTGLHGIHLIAGVFALGYLLCKVWRSSAQFPPATHYRLAATYWHFVGVLWVYLFLVLFVFG